jgi:hypothetical protein
MLSGTLDDALADPHLEHVAATIIAGRVAYRSDNL